GQRRHAHGELHRQLTASLPAQSSRRVSSDAKERAAYAALSFRSAVSDRDGDGVLAGRGGVQLGAHRVERLRDFLRVVGALEEQVLVEVPDAGAVVALAA